MAFDPLSLALSKGYTEATAEGMGAVQGKPGPAGRDGVTPDIQVGTVTTLSPGQSATVTRQPDSPDSAPVFDFGIPQGEKGEPGTNGGGGGGNGSSLIAGDGLTIAEGVVSVDTPVRSILTQSEYDALPEDEQNKGLYVIKDSGGSSGGGSDESLDVYSTEEKRIGTWIDGKPLYRRVFTGTSPSSSSQTAVSEVMPFVETVVRIDATMDHGGYCSVAPLYQNSDNFWHIRWIGTNLHALCMTAKNGENQNKPFTITFEYTKTTDEPEVS